MNLSRGLQAERRRRELASDLRAGSWARGRARTAQREFLREKWWLFAIFLAVVVGTALVVGLVLPTLMRGLVLGAALVAAPTAIWVLAMQATGTAPTMMGDQAEQWTAQELRRLHKRGWRLVNHFALKTDDIDHVVIGPGGAWAVETKWSASDWRSKDGLARLERAAAQVTANARSLRLWHEFKSRGIPVNAVVVVWGLSVRKWDEHDHVRLVNGVPVVAGRKLRRWFEETATVSPAVIDADGVDAAWLALDRQVTRRDSEDLKAHPVPRSVAEWVGLSGAAVVGFALAMYALAALLNITSHALLSVAGALLLVAPVALVARVTGSKYIVWAAWAWTATLSLLSVVALGTAAMALL